MSHTPEPEVATVLMVAAAGGDKAAADRLLALVYEQLRKTAQQNLQRGQGTPTISATALVHEAYLKLVGPREVPWAGRGHFYAAAALAMRQVLLDRARIRQRRGDKPLPLTELGDVAALAEADPDRIVAVEEAMRRLESEDPESAAVVRLRFYAGLTVEQAAETLGISTRTATRLWAYARAVLYRELRDGA